MVEVRIDKKIHSWSGSIEMGITQCDPNMLEVPFPSSATELREGTWIMSGNSILRDGRSINENYGTDLDKLEEGDRVGVLRTSQGDLLFFVNGVSQVSSLVNWTEFFLQKVRYSLLNLSSIGSSRLQLTHHSLCRD